MKGRPAFQYPEVVRESVLPPTPQQRVRNSMGLAVIGTAPVEAERRARTMVPHGEPPPPPEALSTHWSAGGGGEPIGPLLVPFINLNPRHAQLMGVVLFLHEIKK